MRIARVETADGIVTGEYIDGVVETDAGNYTVGEDAELRAPTEPSSFFCVGRNYAAYNEAQGHEEQDFLHWFLKPPIALHDPETPIPYPDFTEEFGCAGELAAVIDEPCKNVSAAEAPEYVRGFTIMNDLDAEDQPEISSRKAFDHAAPLGPWIETDVDPTSLDMTTKINGEVGQEANTTQMIWGPWEIIAEISRYVTLRPDDVVAYGGPDSPDLLEPGDDIEMWYEGIGTLRNTVGPRA